MYFLGGLMNRAFAAFLGLLFLAGTAFGDVVTLKNGDRITGTLVTIKGGTLQLKSDVLGSLSIPMDKVATYTVDKPVAVIVKGKEPVQGTLELSPKGDWQVKDKSGQTQTISAATVDTIMTADDYQKLVVANPRVWQAWKGALTIGESIQRGNQDTNTFTGTLAATRERPDSPIFRRHTRTNFGATVLLAHATEVSADPATTPNTSITSHTLSANLREDYLFSPRTFAFAIGQVDHISTEGLYIRETGGGGFGEDIVKNPHTTFSVLGGLTYQHEKFFIGTEDQSADALVGETFGEQFSKRIRLDNNLNFYPNFSNLGQYRFDTTTVLAVKIFNRFSLSTSFIDLFLSNPPPGNHQNNVTLSLGIGYTF
jgi:putative salt-induced outer membrane protein YdiY